MSRVAKSGPKPRAVNSHSAAIISQIQAEPQEQLMANENFDADIVVIGAGPGGYVAAIRAAQMGASVICVEKEFLGGTCLNWGCIPSKAMIAGVERLNQVKHAKDFGVVIQGEIGFDFDVYSKRRDKIVQTQRGGIGMLFKKNNIRHIEGFANFEDPHTITVTKDGKSEIVRGKNFILAMGSSAIHIKIPGLEGGRAEGVWTSDDAVAATHVPKSMLVLGGGAVGTEFSYVFNGLGSKVTLVEMMPQLIPLMDSDLGLELGKSLKKQGITVMTGAGLERCERIKEGWRCYVRTGGKEQTIDVEVVLLGVGRKANTDGMHLDKIGVKLHSKGVELVDDSLRTHVPNIYAIGDICGRIQLAHVASAEGIHAVNNILKGTNQQFDYKVVPNCVYTLPEVASVGLTQSQAETAGHEVVVGKANFRILGKAMAIGEVDGFVKIVAEKKYGEVLGVHMVGPHVTDLLAAGAAALKLEATIEIMAEMIHAHPTLAEAMLEAYEDALGHAIHKM